MAQAKKVFNSKAEEAMRKLNDNKPTDLADNMEIVERDGGVYLRTKRIRYTERPNGTVGEFETILETRCDCEMDMEARAAGITPWWEDLMKQQRARDAAAKKAPKKEA